jgi:anti-sigma regulatory factor (Ser/Thr protein kinase)
VPPPHACAVVDGPEELAAVGTAFLGGALDAGDAALLSATPDAAELLLGALGDRAQRVALDPRATLVGSRPPDAFLAVQRHLERALGSGAPRLRAVAVVDPGPTEQDWRECQRFEAVSNLFLGDAPVAGLCVYDRSRLAAPLVESATATHPAVLTVDGWRPNPDYVDPVRFVEQLPVLPEPEEAGEPLLVVDDAPRLPALRHALTAAVDSVVRDPEQREDLHLAFAEIAANAFRHGSRPVSARVWASAERVVCAITDGGRGFADRTAGYVPAHGDDLALGGMGLWLARKLCDHVDLVPGPRGLTVRLVVGLR